MSTSTIYGLTYEFSHQNGKSIVFTELASEKLTEENLHAVQLKMMQSTRIPHVLPLSVENIDLKTKLHYDITNKKNVLSFFRNSSTTMSDYYQVLLSIIKTLETSSSYMLDQEQFIVETDFIFIGEQPSDVYLTYVPVTNLTKDSTLIDDMKLVLTNIAGEVEGLQGNEFKSILNYIKDPAFSLSGLKKLILELISLRSNINQVPTYHQVNNHIPQMNNQGTENNSNHQFANENETLANEVTTQKTTSTGKKKKVKKKLPKLSSREGTYLIVAALLFSGISWKLFEMNQTQVMLIVSSSLTVVILLAVIVYWKIWRPGVKPIVTEEWVKDSSKPAPQPVSQQPNKQASEQNVNYMQMKQISARENVAPVYEQNVNGSQQAAATMSMDTVLLDHISEDTVLLGDDQDLDESFEQQTILPLFVKETSQGQVENIQIIAANFLIGRNADSVNYAEDAVGVSRIHAEVVKIDNMSYAVKDLGSKNGSKLNGNKMIPYKIYALNENDQIELGKASYTFKWSTSQ